MLVDKIRTNFQTFEGSVKSKLKHHHRQFSNDDELIGHYRKDIKTSVKALKFIVSQTKRFSSHYWPRVFKTNLAITKGFLDLMGQDSLLFKGMEGFYEEFDKLQADKVIPSVHPKEKQFLIDSAYHELWNYYSSMEQLFDKIVNESQWHAESVQLRVGEMNKYLKQLLKLISKRNKKQSEYNKLHKNVQALMKKTVPLDEKEKKLLATLDKKLKEASDVFSKLDDKLKSILPHALLLLEEFVETLTKSLLCKQLEIYKEIDEVLKYFAVFHGFVNLKHDPKNDDLILPYEAIIDQWEQTMTPTRLQLESFITIVGNKNPDLIDEEIDDESNTLKREKLWNKLTRKMSDKSHKLKSEDKVNGVFTDYLTADPLDSFLKYQNPHMNRTETYYPSRIVDESEVSVPPPAKQNPPPLPPRSNSAKMLPQLPTKSSLSGRFLSRVNIKRTNSTDSFESILLESLSSSDDENDSTMASQVILAGCAPDMVHQSITKMYNTAKNDIKVTPVTTTDTIYSKINPAELNFFNQTSSASYTLMQMHKFFDRILSFSNSVAVERRVLIATHDFDGVEPGDLSFKEGDKVEILFDFQMVDTLYSRDHKNWMIGMAGSRIGFIPNNYFA